jgi:hypothetical protein
MLRNYRLEAIYSDKPKQQNSLMVDDIDGARPKQLHRERRIANDQRK